MNTNSTPNSIYIDGAAPNNQSGCTQGGIGMVVFDDESNIVYQMAITIKGETDSAEVKLMALVEGLEYAKDGDIIYSDNEFCVKGCNEWLKGWKAKGWRRADKKPVAYLHLWQQVDVLLGAKSVEVVKVKAHIGIGGNEKADAFASMAARS